MLVKYSLYFLILNLPLWADIKFLKSSNDEHTIFKLKEENKNLKKDIKNQETVNKFEQENRRLALVKECNQNEVEACVDLAESYFLENNFNKGIEVLKEKCEIKLANICLLIANKYLAKKDFNNSLKYLAKACDGSDFDSCNQLGILQFRNRKTKEALETFNKNCSTNNNLQSCFNALLAKEGQNSYLQNLNLFWELCSIKKSTESCNKVVELTQIGTQKCFNKINSFCLDLGSFEFNRQEYIKAQKVYNFSCELGDPVGCYNLGQALWYNEGLEAALIGWKKACDLKDEYSCGYYYGVKKHEEAFKASVNKFETNCEKIDMNSCFQAASIYAVKADKAGAIKFLKKAIEYGLANSQVFEGLKEFDFLKKDTDFKFIIKTLNNN
ncbi:MAG: hypothetical protein U0T83_08885 [Bacteriovoracaceae bacterium]